MNNKRKRGAGDGDDIDTTGLVQDVRFLKTRMSPKHLLKFINSNLSEKQVQDIRSIGFEGLLTLKTNMVPGSLAYWLVSTFDTCSSSLMEGKLPITDEDIHLTTGLPMGHREVELASTQDKSQGFLQLKQKFLKQFGESKTEVGTSEILDLIINQRGGGDDFKRNFIVFAASSFFMGVSGNLASLRILKCLGDMTSVSSLNWCHFTRKQFIEEVDSWRKTKKVGLNFGGPIMVFVFIYLDRVAFKFHIVDRVFPTLASWTREAMSSRINSEKCDGFGKGAVIARIVKTEVRVVNLSLPSSTTNLSVIQDASPFKPVENTKKDDSSIKKLADAATALADCYNFFLKALIEAKFERPNCDIVRQMTIMADSFCHPMKDQKDANTDDKGKAAENDQKVEEDGVGFDFLEVDEELDPRHEFALAALLSLRKCPVTTRTSETEEMTHDQSELAFKPSDFQQATPSISCRRSPRLTAPPQLTRPTFAPPSEEMVVEHGHVESTQSSSMGYSICASPVSPLPPLPTKMNKVPTQVFKSPLLKRDVQVVGELNQVEKDVLEPAFSESYNDSKQALEIATPTVFPYTDKQLVSFVCNNRKNREYLDENLVDTEWMQVTRGALRSLRGRNWIMDLVIDMFGVMCTLNRTDVLYLPTTARFVKNRVKAGRKNIWSPYLKMHYMPENGSSVDKVFITIGDGEHWYAVVSDVTKQKNLIFDSMMPREGNRKRRDEHINDIIHNCEKAILKSNGYNRWLGMSLFDTENVQVPQQINCFDCGAYVMKFLEATIDDKLWTDEKHFEVKSMPAYRQCVMLKLLKWEKNRKKWTRLNGTYIKARLMGKCGAANG